MKLYVMIDEQHRDRVLSAAPNHKRLSQWINTVVLPAFFNPSGIDAIRAENDHLRQELARLNGEVAGLRFALSQLRRAGPPILNEGSENGYTYQPTATPAAPGYSHYRPDTG